LRLSSAKGFRKGIPKDEIYHSYPFYTLSYLSEELKNEKTLDRLLGIPCSVFVGLKSSDIYEVDQLICRMLDPDRGSRISANEAQGVLKRIFQIF
jgi:hypothetical protein